MFAARILLAVSLLPFAGLSAQAEPMEIHSNHWVFGYPLGMPATNDLVIRNSYALSNNDTTKFADWVGLQAHAQGRDGHPGP